MIMMAFLKGLLDHIIVVVPPIEMEEDHSMITPQLLLEFNVPNEIIHRIQSLLPAKDAARTCVLSKSWLHAWSTIPTLRFTKCVTHDNLTLREKLDYVQLIDRTLLRYLNDNMSIECFHLHLDIHNSSLPYPLDRWFQALASTNCPLKDISLTMCLMKDFKDGWLTLPDAIFSCQNLDTLCLKALSFQTIGRVRVNTNPVIKCSLLRVLELCFVHITEGALHNLFSSCTLLEKLHLDLDLIVHLKNIKVQNLRFLREFKLMSFDVEVLEINDVPSLQLLSYFSVLSRYTTMRMDTLGSIRELVLSNVPVDDAFSEMIKSKFPFLENLKLSVDIFMHETIDITCVTLKRFSFDIFSDKQFNIQVSASELLYFSYDGVTMPKLLFPSSTPAHIKLILRFHKHSPIDLFYILKVREALDLPSNFDIETIDCFVPSNIHLDYLRRMVPFPARNVQQLSFGKHWEQNLWKHTPVLDLLLSIFFPRYIKAYYRSPGSRNYWHKQMVRIMEKKMCDLRDIEIKNPRDGKWETLTNSWRSSHFVFELPWRSFYDEEVDYNSDDDCDSDEFKLNLLS